ncbi:MAG: cytochrome C biogenesis protein [Rhodospirillaceae bacterium]|nr:cytochrome C biogenesis protein [Rhodospirillaceae bacterium]
MNELSTIGIISAFVAGIISFLSPCVLPLVPGYISYVAGGTLEDLTEHSDKSRHRLAAILLSIFFVLGFSIVFIALGASASAVGDFLLKYKTEFEYAAGGIIVAFGLYLTGMLKLPILSREMRFVSRFKGGHPISAIILGMAFAFGWTPCIGPVLGSILTLSARSGEISNGVILLAIYSIGLGIPFIIAAGFTGLFLKRIKTLRKIGRPFQIMTGIIMVVMGISMITGHFRTFGFILIETFPGLATIG